MSPRIHSINDVRSFTGESLGFSPYVTITAERIRAFADATDDHQWIHVDEERAKAGPYGRTIAHGYLIVSMIPALLNQVLDVEVPGTRINYGLNRVRFISPVPAESDIRLGATLVEVTPAGEGWQMVFDVTIELRDHDKPACVAQVLYRWYPS